MSHQVNSMQDYVTQRKRQIIAATYRSSPPPQFRKHNGQYLSVKANGATVYTNPLAPPASNNVNNVAFGRGVTYTSLCCLTTGQAV